MAEQEQQMGFGGGGDEDDMPPEMKDHMLKAFAHAQGLGPHPGMYKGPPRRKRDPDEITDTDRQRAEEEPLEDRPQEAGYRKMRAAATGASLDLGPTEAEQKQAQQQGALQQRQAAQSQAQAAQAQAGQSAVTPPPAPAGPTGTQIPYPAQARQESPGEAIPATQAQPPPAPGPIPPETAANP